jgi:hypothetical protein
MTPHFPTFSAPTPSSSASVLPPETNTHLASQQPQPPDSELLATIPSLALDLITPAELFRHSGWARDRGRVLDSLKRTLQPVARLLRFANCGYGTYVMASNDEPPRYRVVGSTCHDRFCLPCSQARSRTISLNVLERLKTAPVRFLTLTVNTNQQTLHMAIDHLLASFQRLRRSVPWQLHVTGGVAFLEVKWMPDTARWHPHLHCLIEGTYFPHYRLKTAWQQATSGSTIVWIVPVRGRDSIARYVTKYAAKPLNQSFLRDPARLDEAVLALHGRRLSITFGTWRGVALTPKPSDEGWHYFEHLDTLLFRAAAGDVDALQVLAQIDPKATPYAVALARMRSPPAGLSLTPQPSQLKLFPTSPYIL